MSSDLQEALAAYRAVLDKYAGLPLSGMTAAELRMLLKRIKDFERRLAARQHELINQLSNASPEELGGELPDVLAKRLRISRGEAALRIEEARKWAARSGK
jgi:Domain of unknown function (DUF222)